LGRPISGVDVEVQCWSGKQAISLNFKSDQAGMVYGIYDAALCEPSSVSVDKPGYQKYFSGFRERYILKRQFTADGVDRIVKFDSVNQLTDLRELLAGENRFQDSLFYYEARLRPILRILAQEPEVTKPARDLLSLIAEPEDLHLIMQLPPPPKSTVLPDRWIYAVVTALVGPDDEDEWSFLERCAANEFNDRWVDAGAIQTLRLTGTARSEKILEQVRLKNPVRATLIARALDYIKSNPRAVLADTDLEALARRVAQALNIGTWEGNHPPRFNEGRDKALVDLTFQTGSDYLVYTATFHSISGTWTLRGVHETSQAFRGSGTLPRKQ
jgi:hypothetical protein